MTNVYFKSIDSQEVKEEIPEFYYPEGLFYSIIKNKMKIGFVGLSDIGYCNGYRICNLGYFVYPQFRHSQTKEQILSIINFPQTLGFDICMYLTLSERIRNVLSTMSRYGVRYRDKFDGHYCFYKVYED